MPACNGSWADTLSSSIKSTDYRVTSSIRRGWKLGAEDFVDWILDRVRIETNTEHPPPDREEPEQAKAARIIRDELKRLTWTESDLRQHRKSHPRKASIASRLRTETAVTLKWIGEALQMGSAGHVASQIRRHSKPSP